MLRFDPSGRRPVLDPFGRPRAGHVHAAGLGLLLAALLAPLQLGSLVWTAPPVATTVHPVDVVAPAASRSRPARPAYDPADPATWSARALAAQLTVSCVDMGDLDAARRQAAAGIGGITLLGRPPAPARLRGALAAVRRAGAGGPAPFVMSDEEGGAVQRLRAATYRVPSAATMGGWSRAHVRRTARAYGARLRGLGVGMDLAPVADLTVPGSYMTGLRRTFSSDPGQVARRVDAWRRGMDDAGIASAVKHWPGHGHAANTHDRPAAVPPLAQLRRADLLPFEAAMRAGAPVVMVGHLSSRGLTEPGAPASESPRALRYLRRTAGPDTVILTDSLSMAAASSARGVTPVGAELRALRAGADWALVCNTHPMRAVAAVRAAITSGRLPRARAVASARRIVALKARYGLLPR